MSADDSGEDGAGVSRRDFVKAAGSIGLVAAASNAAVEVDVDNLVHATEVASEYGDGVYFGYDASQAQAALRRMKADARDGESHGAPE